MQALTVAKRLDWDGWLLGIMGAIISGGTGAISSGIAGTLLAPNEINVTGGHTGHLFALMGITFGISGLVSLAKYLQQKPIPDYVAPDEPKP